MSDHPSRKLSLDRTHLSNLVTLSILSKPGPNRPALPLELILQILNYPPFWIRADHLQLNRSVRVSDSPGKEVLLRTQPFTQELLNSLREVVFTFSSRDQGWSSFRSDYGTYENSWTWFSMAIIKANLENDVDDQPGLPEPSRLSIDSGDSEDGGIAQRKSTDEDQYILQRNRHAGDVEEDYRIKMIVDEEPLQDLQVGDAIVLLACARFGGWTNHVKEAAIEIWTVDDLIEVMQKS